MQLSESATLTRIRRPGPRKGRRYRGIAASCFGSAVFYRSAGGPGRPFRGRRAVFAPPERKIAAHPRGRSPSLRAARRSWRPGAQKPRTIVVWRRRGGAGGGRREATGARTRKKHLRNRHLSLVLEVEIVAVPPPARGRRPAALRPTVEPACRTQPGRSGLRVCRAFAGRGQRIGVPQAIRAPQVPDRPRFCGPAAKIRRAARNLGDPGFGSAVFFRSGGQKSACRTRSGRPVSRFRRAFYGLATKNRRAARNPGDPGLRSAPFLRSGGEESACRT